MLSPNFFPKWELITSLFSCLLPSFSPSLSFFSATLDIPSIFYSHDFIVFDTRKYISTSLLEDIRTDILEASTNDWGLNGLQSTFKMLFDTQLNIILAV